MLKPKLIASSLVVLFCAGCASYRPAPIDIAEIDAQHRARVSDLTPVSTFAQHLREAGAPLPARIDPSDGLSLAEAEVLALFWNPQLTVARAEAGVSGADAAAAGAWPTPEISFDVLHALESVANPWKLAGALSLSLPLSGRLGAERAHAAQIAEGARLSVHAAEWSTLTVLRDSWITWSATMAEQQASSEIASELTRLAALAESWRAVGELSDLAARAIQIAAIQAQLRTRELTATASQQRLAIVHLLGLTPETPFQLQPSLSVGADVLQALGNSDPTQDARVQAGLAAHQVAEARLRLAVREQYPDLQLGLGYEDDSGERALGPVLGFSLPLWSSNRRDIARGEAERVVTAAQVAAAYAAARHDQARARLVIDDHRSRLDIMEREVVPLLDKQVQALTQIAALGESDVSLHLEVLKAVYDGKRDLITLQAELGQAHNRLLALSLPAWLTALPTTTEETKQ